MKIQQHNEVQSETIDLIDAHHHLWNLDSGKYPWLQDYNPDTFMGDYRPIMRNYLPDDYLQDSSCVNLLATVHCEADRDYSDEVTETRWVENLSQIYGFPNAIIGHVFFHHDNCEEILKQHCQSSLFRGIRSKPVTASSVDHMKDVYGVEGSMQDDKWLCGFSLLEKYNLSWDLRVPFWHLEEAAEVASLFPHIAIVLNHTGFPWDRSEEGLDIWRRGMRALSHCKNVSVKISELSVPGHSWNFNDNKNIVRETIAIFGINRCMFASNFPVAGLRISYKELVANMNEFLQDFSAEEKALFFWKNAKTFYRINI